MIVPILVILVYSYVGMIVVRADRERLGDWCDVEGLPYAVLLFVVLAWPIYVSVHVLTAMFRGWLRRPPT